MFPLCPRLLSHISFRLSFDEHAPFTPPDVPLRLCLSLSLSRLTDLCLFCIPHFSLRRFLACWFGQGTLKLSLFRLESRAVLRSHFSFFRSICFKARRDAPSLGLPPPTLAYHFNRTPDSKHGCFPIAFVPNFPLPPSTFLELITEKAFFCVCVSPPPSLAAFASVKMRRVAVPFRPLVGGPVNTHGEGTF